MPTVDLKRAAAIVGIHEHITRYAPDKSELQVQGESVIKAVEDAGLTKNDVDGLLTAGNIRNSGLNLADYLDMYPKMVDNTTVGGGSFEFHLSPALNAIAAGRINCAVITYSSLARSGGISVGTGGVARFGHPRLDPSPDSFEELYGLTTVGLYAMIAQRHMHLYGTTSEQLAEVAVAARKHASLNPEALFRDPITVQDVVNSRIISTPVGSDGPAFRGWTPPGIPNRWTNRRIDSANQNRRNPRAEPTAAGWPGPGPATLRLETVWSHNRRRPCPEPPSYPMSRHGH